MVRRVVNMAARVVHGTDLLVREDRELPHKTFADPEGRMTTEMVPIIKCVECGDWRKGYAKPRPGWKRMHYDKCGCALLARLTPDQRAELLAEDSAEMLTAATPGTDW